MDLTEKPALKLLMREFIDNTMHRSMSNNFHFNREHNLSVSQMMILHRLYKGGSASVSEISKMLDISNSAVSQLLDKLVQMDFVSRWEKPEDRRKKYHSITKPGEKILEESKKSRTSWIDSLNENITPDETEILTEALTIMVNKIKQLEPVHHHDKNCPHRRNTNC